MNKFKLLSIFTILVVFSFQAFSQGNLSLHFGPSFPMGEFGNDDIDDNEAGLAGMGFGAGLSYVYPLNDNGLGLYGGIDFIINPLSKDAKDDIQDAEGSTSEFTFPNNINIPISAGIDYTYKANDQLSLYGQGGLTLSLFKLTDFIWLEEGFDDYEQKHDLSTSFGFNLGAGFIINNKFDIGLKYFGLGEHGIEGEYEYGTDDGNIDYDQKVSLLMVTLGFRL